MKLNEFGETTASIASGESIVKPRRTHSVTLKSDGHQMSITVLVQHNGSLGDRVMCLRDAVATVAGLQ